MSRNASCALSGSAETPSTAVLAFGELAREPGEVDRLLGAARRVGAGVEKQHQLSAREVRERNACRRRRAAGGRRALAPSPMRLDRTVRGSSALLSRLLAGFRPRPGQLLGRLGRAGCLNGSRALWDAFAERRGFLLLLCLIFAAAGEFSPRLSGRCLADAWRSCRSGSRLSSRRRFWGISCAFSWTYAFLSSLSADQSLGYCGSCPAGWEPVRCAGQIWLTSEYGDKEFDATSVRSLNVLLGPDDE